MMDGEKVEIRPKWDWKNNIIDTTIVYTRGWNQTKMGLKGERAAPFLPLLRVVEIRPKWDWKNWNTSYTNPELIIVEIRPKWDWKRFKSYINSDFASVLKSDQNGIESCKEFLAFLPFCSLLKSDQNGIESWINFVMTLNQAVEIRPKWDWKHDAVDTQVTSSKKLKSDQNGIKRIARVTAFTKSNTVEIRPKWDWKLKFYIKCIIKIRRWNQTKMGLKATL